MIVIYWQVIGFFALRYNLSVDHLTAVVLIHELAHAFTHRGKDIDKINWNTDLFAQTDLFIVEGLAQFYTEILGKKLYDRFPQILETYQELLKHQSGPYLAHKEWLSDDKRIGEVIRLALIQIRMDNRNTYKEFNKNLSQIRHQITERENFTQQQLF